jgi:arylsulfatase A-like enzyme
MVVAVHRRRPGRPAASALQTTGELANTLVIFTSDNGFLDNATPPNVTFREYYYLPPTRTSSSTSWPTAFPATTRTPPPLSPTMRTARQRVGTWSP